MALNSSGEPSIAFYMGTRVSLLTVWIFSPVECLVRDHFLMPRPYAGKWHRSGQMACYAYEHPALGLLEREIAMRLPLDVPVFLYEAAVPMHEASIVELGQCRAGQERAAGGRFFDSDHLIASVPSSACPEGRVLLINPRHPTFSLIELVRRRAIPAATSARMGLANA